MATRKITGDLNVTGNILKNGSVVNILPTIASGDAGKYLRINPDTITSGDVISDVSLNNALIANIPVTINDLYLTFRAELYNANDELIHQYVGFKEIDGVLTIYVFSFNSTTKVMTINTHTIS